MHKQFLIYFILIFSLIVSPFVSATDADDAKEAANLIMAEMSNGNYKDVWRNYMSNWFKSKLTKDSFLSKLSLGRSMLGKKVSSKLIDIVYSKNDPAHGYQGDIYAFTFKNQYQGATLYERVVVVKEDGNSFKLAGFWANPAQ